MVDTPNIEIAPARDDDQKPERKAAVVPTRLSEFLALKGASAAKFVGARSKRPALSEEDLAQATEIAAESLPKLLKVVELAQVAAQTRPQPAVLLRWCEDIVRIQDESLREWARDDTSGAIALRQLIAWASPLLNVKDKTTRRQVAEATLMIGLNTLIARRSLTPLEALRCFGAVSATRGTGPSIPTKTEVGKMLARAKAKQLFDLARVVALSDSEIAAAKDAAQTAAISEGNLRRQKEALERASVEQEAIIKGLNLRSAQQASHIDGLSADLDAARIRAAQNASKLKARFRRQIGNTLAGLLGDAWDALDTDPPHPDVAKERLELAKEWIRREMEWLDESSD